MKTGITLLACFITACNLSTRAQVNIDVDVAQKGIEISPTLYGIFYEDINFASDGGLYAELIRNRSFEQFNQGEGYKILSIWKREGSAACTAVSEGLLNESRNMP